MHFVPLILSIAAGVVTLAVGIYMAQPWGDNYAYQSLGDYVVLLIMLSWATAPYLYIFHHARRASLPEAAAISNIVAALVVCVGGIYLMVDAGFINIDAQGGLILIVLPFYQWLFIGACRCLARFWRARRAP